MKKTTEKSYQERINKVLIYIQQHLDEDISLETLANVACVSINDDIKPAGEIGVQTLRGCEYTTVTHKGHYHELAEVYHWLIGTWLPKSGREAENISCFEIYRNSPETTKPKDLITEIYLALK